MSHTKTLQAIFPAEELTINPLQFTVSDIIDIANILKKEPIEIFESILNDLAYNELIKDCERVADELLSAKRGNSRTIKLFSDGILNGI